jgi:hypothetical protein
MIVCHCNVITSAEIIAIIDAFLAEDSWRMITPVLVYHALGKRGRCCGCFPTVVDLIVERTLLARGGQGVDWVERMVGEWKRDERRYRGHQAA